MTEHHPHTATRQHDYIPAFGKDALLPFYDLLTRFLGMGRSYDTLVAQAELADGLRVLESVVARATSLSASSVMNRVPTWSAPTRTPWRSPGRNGKHVG